MSDPERLNRFEYRIVELMRKNQSFNNFINKAFSEYKKLSNTDQSEMKGENSEGIES